MIGLEYIVNLYNKQFKDVAEQLGISKQVVNGWIKGRYKISKKHLPKLSKMFNVPEEYFQKEVNDVDKFEIQKIKLNNEYIEIEETYVDRETGKEVTHRYVDSNWERHEEQILYEIKVKELHKNLQQTIDNKLKTNNENITLEQLRDESEKVVDVLNEFIKIIQRSKVDVDTLKKVIIGIKMYEEKKEPEDQLSKDICVALNINHEKEVNDILKNEDMFRSLGYGDKLDEIKKINNIK